MELTQGEVDDFMLAEKIVPARRSRVIEWDCRTPDKCLWRAPIEVDAVRVGEIVLFVNPSFDRSWIFKLRYQEQTVYAWHVRPIPGNHPNPGGRPRGFPRKVPEPEHEHIWVKGLECSCAKPLPGLETSDHSATFQSFCKRTRVRCKPVYSPPQPQLLLGPEK